jgi:hypothetical protein
MSWASQVRTLEEEVRLTEERGRREKEQLRQYVEDQRIDRLQRLQIRELQDVYNERTARLQGDSLVLIGLVNFIKILAIGIYWLFRRR